MNNEVVLKSIIENDINNLWDKYKNEPFCEVPPLAVEKIPNINLLFIGINPSLGDDDRDRLLKYNSKNLEYYDLHAPDSNMHKYFNKFKEIADKTVLKWSHIDLLYIRETQQNKVGELIKEEKGLDFIYQQLMASKKVLDAVIENSDKLIIIVNNTLARLFLGKSATNNENVWMGYDINAEIDPYLGTNVLTHKNQKVPIFFTSMLTGQRALDNGSFERLIWHIDFVNKQLQ